MRNLGVPSFQRGVVLIVSLILLLAVTMMIVTASNLVQTDLKIVQNMESRERVRAAAIAAIEEAISSGDFRFEPDLLFGTQCDGSFRTRCYDLNGTPDNSDDIRVVVERPSCVIVTPIENAELDVFNDPAAASCYLPPAIYSMCANSVWEFQAVATDPVTGSEISVRQGISILTTLNAVDTVCPS
ncbi:MAG: hypothetical protein ABJL54_00600 [Halioglobus sp.]